MFTLWALKPILHWQNVNISTKQSTKIETKKKVISMKQSKKIEKKIRSKPQIYDFEGKDEGRQLLAKRLGFG